VTENVTEKSAVSYTGSITSSDHSVYSLQFTVYTSLSIVNYEIGNSV
jgi:hypothetical protein